MRISWKGFVESTRLILQKTFLNLNLNNPSYSCSFNTQIVSYYILVNGGLLIESHWTTGD